MLILSFFFAIKMFLVSCEACLTSQRCQNHSRMTLIVYALAYNSLKMNSQIHLWLFKTSGRTTRRKHVLLN